jgi:hypothetical protein
MARFREVIQPVTRKRHKTRTKPQAVLACVVFVLAAVLLIPTRAGAEVARPTIVESVWATGQVEVYYTGVTPGHKVMFFGTTYRTAGVFDKMAEWIDDGSGQHTVKFLENGQTVWFYILVQDPATGDISYQSNETRVTPPITAYVINWPEMKSDLGSLNDALKDAVKGIGDQISNAITTANNDMKNFIQVTVTPSTPAMDDVAAAVDELKNAIGAGSAAQTGTGLKSGFENIGNSGKPPIAHDDGQGTFTGGSSPGTLPPLIGTSNEATWCFQYTVDMSGNPVKACLFTNEQMEKLKWWKVIYDVISVVPWILFAVWVVQRFTPQFKV